MSIHAVLRLISAYTAHCIRKDLAMKKWIAGLALSMMLLGSTVAFAEQNPSPEGTPTTEVTRKSPKTDDFNIAYVEGLGIVLLLGAGGAFVKYRKHA